MKYRNAVKGDEDQVLKVIGTVLSKYGLELEPNGADYDVTDIEKFYFNDNGWFQVVENNNEIIGSVGVYKIDEKKCELRKMYLYSEYQGQGIGKQLMENALNKAKSLGYKKMELQTNSLLYKALPLYNKYGFKNDDNEVCSRCDISMIKEL
ncbi:MAG: GNAT family N-acetyltransferase [Clostridium sp.]